MYTDSYAQKTTEARSFTQQQSAEENNFENGGIHRYKSSSHRA